MLLRPPLIDHVLPFAFLALALVAAVDFARADMPNGVALSVTAIYVALLWARAVLPAWPDQGEREDG